MDRERFQPLEVVVAIALLATVMRPSRLSSGKAVREQRRDETRPPPGHGHLEKNKWSFTEIYTRFGLASTSGAVSGTVSPTHGPDMAGGITAADELQATIALTPLGLDVRGRLGHRVPGTIDCDHEYSTETSPANGEVLTDHVPIIAVSEGPSEVGPLDRFPRSGRGSVEPGRAVLGKSGVSRRAKSSLQDDRPGHAHRRESG